VGLSLPRERVIARAERGNALNWTGLAAVRGLGSPFLSADLFNTVLLRLGATDFVLGLFALNQIISLPSQFLAARTIDRTEHKVRVAWLASVAGILPVLLPLSVLAVTGGKVGMWVFFAAVSGHLLVSQVAGAFNGVAQMDLLSRVLRAERRGTLFGFQGSLGGLSGILGGLALASVMARLEYPSGFISAWSIGIFLSVGGSLLLLRLRELPGLRLRRRAVAPGMRQAFAAVMEDRRFVVFLVAVVARMGFGATQYYIWPTARRLHGLPDEYVGYLVSVNAAIAMISAPGIGWLADRWGRAATGLAFSAVAVVGFVLFPQADGRALLLVAYVLIGIGTSGITMPLYLSVIDLSPADRRGFYVAVRYGTESAVYMLFLPLFGFISTVTAPHIIFYAGAALAGLAGIILFRVAMPASHPGGPSHTARSINEHTTR
jgi:MFS family permease